MSRVTDAATKPHDPRIVYGQGWSEKPVRHGLRRAETFPEEATFSALAGTVSWTHIKTLMYLDESNIRVAEYLTQLPPRETLQAKLHQSIAIARQKLLNAEDP